ncbi:GrpB family protein [Patescibacteria group bacterium]|nr:GrpB family protein [Patescibacteria group bacterium]MBU1074769.1 GrpB family protein [Patescibacteria group bacterium]MBU1951516.1 GrpB family protein [Patescibacteria group bacterium]
MQKYVFRKYDPEYVKFFEMERKRVKKVLGDIAVVEHVGSTAVKGLGGKGIIDIMVGVHLSDLDKANSKLVKDGYEYRKAASVPGRIFFRKDYVSKTKTRRIHIHLVIKESREWIEIVLFRDYLKEHPDTVKEYSEIKKQAVKTAKGDGKTYRKIKEKFIKDTLKK